MLSQDTSHIQKKKKNSLKQLHTEEAMGNVIKEKLPFNRQRRAEKDLV